MTTPPEIEPTRNEALHSAYDDARLRLSRLHIDHPSSFRNVFRQFAEIVTETLKIDRFGIWLFVDEGRAIRCLHLYQVSKSDMFEGAILHQKDFPGYFQAIRSQVIIPVNTTDRSQIADQLYESYLKPLGITALLDVPLFRGGKVVGVVCHEHAGNSREWTQDECNFTTSISEIISRLFSEVDRLKAENSIDTYQHHFMEIQRMEALGHLAAGVAHDFRNILTVIIGQCEYINDIKTLPPVVYDAITDILDAARRGDSLTSELLTFGKQTPDAPQVLDLGVSVGKLRNMLQLAIGRSIDLSVAYKEPLSRVFLDPAQLERVLMNLVMNSRDAIKSQSGSITITMEDTKITGGEGDGGTYVCLSVQDSGVGMDDQTRSRIFDPFFSTKGDKGTGLGLAIVYQIISRAGGFIETHSKEGQGTTFNLYLPRIGSQV